MERSSKRVVVAIALGALAAGCAGKPVETVESRLAMDTQVTIRAVGPSEAVTRRALGSAWKEMEECIFRLDNYRKPSEAWLKGDPAALADRAQQPSDVWRINADAGKWSTEVDPLVTSCLTAAREVWELTGGAFDPTVGPLVALWRRAGEENRLPTDDQIAQSRALVGVDKVEILIAEVPREPQDLSGGPAGGAPAAGGPVRAMSMVSLMQGMKLDLGGIAKGYIVGRMAQRLKQAGATAGLVAAAGDIYAFGERPAGLGGEPGRLWGVAVQDPRYPDDPNHFYTRIHVRDQAVDTSGHYYRGYAIEGRRYSHIIDPRTGRPVDERLASVTVVAQDAALSDALATAIAVLGAKRGLEIVNQMTGVECLVLEVDPSDEHPLQASGAPAPEAKLIAHRSRGFAALEFKPPE
jgi:thiamine biosynthesis lipoprotein